MRQGAPTQASLPTIIPGLRDIDGVSRCVGNVKITWDGRSWVPATGFMD